MGSAAGSGKGAGGQVISGGGKFVLPFVQDYKYMSLMPMALSIKLGGALSLEKIRVNMPTVFTVAIGSTDEAKKVAASRLLAMSPKDIEQQCSSIIQGGLRVRLHCRFVLPLINCTPESLTYSVPLFLKRQCDRTLGGLRAVVAQVHSAPPFANRRALPSLAHSGCWVLGGVAKFGSQHREVRQFSCL